MVRVIGIILKDQWLLFNDGMALLADILAQAASFLAVMARATQVSGVEMEKEGWKIKGVKKESAASNNVLTSSVRAAQNSFISYRASE